MIQIAYGIEGKQTHSVVAYGFKGKGATLSSILILDPWQYQADHVDTGKPYTLQEMVDYFAKKSSDGAYIDMWRTIMRKQREKT